MTLLAPNGNPSNLTPQQWELVRTPEFKAWFGDWEKLAMAKVKDPAMDDVTLENLSKNVSKVVDSNGEPLVVYHGTYSKFNIFDKDELGMSQGRSPANMYGFYFTENRNVAQSFGKYLKAFFIKIKKPKTIDIKGGDYSQAKSIVNDFVEKISSKYDGAILFNYKDSGGNKPLLSNQYIVPNSTQIKLADGTNTTFDGNNPDIRYDEGGKIPFNIHREFNEYADKLPEFGYHGTQSETLINPRPSKDGRYGEGFYLTLDPDTAEYFGRFTKTSLGYSKENESANVFQFDLRGLNLKYYKRAEDMPYIDFDELNKKNYDGIYLYNEGEIVIFNIDKLQDGKLIRSKNEIAFNRNNPDIRYDDGGNIDTPDEFYGEKGVGALIYCTSTNRFLLLHRGIYVQEPNTWGMVSGKVDDDDSHLEYAISREIEEELDVVLNNFVPTYIFKKENFTFHNYFAFVEDEFEPRLNWENQEYRWVTLDEFPDNLHFGLKILMEKVDFVSFQPKQEFAEGGSVERDTYSGKEIKKVYVSIRIKYKIERQTAFGGKFGNYEISSIDEKPFIELQNGVLEGVLGVSASSYNLSEWLVHRECLIMMPFDEFLKFNNTEQVQYYDAYYLTKDGLKPFFRLYDRKGTGEQEYYSVVQTILPKIALELELESMVDSDLANDFYIIKSWFDVYNSSAFLKYVASQPRINRPEDFVKYTIEFWKSGEAEKQYYYGGMPTKISEEDIIPAVIRGIVNAGKIYDTESEWLMLDKRLVVPEGSRLFFVQKGYDNLKTEYEKLISRYNLRSKYKINYINQKELDELQSEKFNLKDKEFQEFLNKSRSEVDRKIAKAYKKAEDEIIENWTDKLRVELTEYFDNREFSDDEGNRYGTDIFEVPSVATYYDSLMLKFIELYEGQADMFLKTKNKWILSDVVNSYRDYLNALNDSEGSDYLEVYTDYAKVYKYNIIEKLRYLVIYEYDINKFGNMIKKEVGSDLYRYFQKDEIRLKVGGLA